MRNALITEITANAKTLMSDAGLDKVKPAVVDWAKKYLLTCKSEYPVLEFNHVG